MTGATPLQEVGDFSRVRLARMALAAALAAPGVAGADAGPRGFCVTSDPGGELLRGVSVVAEAGDQYSVDLCLVAELVPLVALAEEIRRRVRVRAHAEGLERRLGTVNVQVVRVVSPDDVAAAPAPANPGTAIHSEREP